jgi:hypothetical protein
MQIEDKRKCKNRKPVNEMEFGTVFTNGQYFFLVTDEGSGDGGYYNSHENNTVLCVNLLTGELTQICEDDQYEVVNAKVTVEA